MNLTQHLEHIIGLVDGKKPLAEIKSAVLAMQEEVSGYEQTHAQTAEREARSAAKNATLQTKNAVLEAELLKFQQKPITDADRKFIEYFCVRNEVVTLQEFAQQSSLPEGKAKYICDGLCSRGFIRRTSLSNIDRRFEPLSDNDGYEITEEGRKFHFEGMA